MHSCNTIFVPHTKTLAHEDTQTHDDDLRTTVHIPRPLRMRAASAKVEFGTTLNQLLVEGLEMRLNQLEGTR